MVKVCHLRASAITLLASNNPAPPWEDTLKCWDANITLSVYVCVREITSTAAWISHVQCAQCISAGAVSATDGQLPKQNPLLNQRSL